MRTLALQLTAKECEAVAALAPYSRVTAARDGRRTRLDTIEQLEMSISRIVDATNGWVLAKDLRIFVGYLDPPASPDAREATLLLQRRVQALPIRAGTARRSQSRFRPAPLHPVKSMDVPAP